MNPYLMLLTQLMEFVGATDERLIYAGNLWELFIRADRPPAGMENFVDLDKDCELRFWLEAEFDGSLIAAIYTAKHGTLDSETFKPIDATVRNLALWVDTANIDPAKVN